MGRHNSRGLQLSFRPYGGDRPGGRWTKTIDGKRHHFGTGTGVSDRASYREALANYYKWMQEQDRRRALADLPLHELLKVPSIHDVRLGDINHLLSLAGIKHKQTTVPLDPDGPITIAYRAERPLSAPTDPNKPNPIAGLFASFITHEKQRATATAANGKATMGKGQLSVKQFAAIELAVNRLAAWLAGPGRLADLSDPIKTDRALQAYRAHLDKQFADGDIAAATVNNAISPIKRLFSHLHTRREIPELPRCLTSITCRYSPTPNPKPLPDATVLKLWALAAGRERTIMALGLNGGFYSSELASIKVHHLTTTKGRSYIAKHREKTHVPYRIPLWAITAKLIAQHRDGRKPEDHLFTDSRGRPLYRTTGRSAMDIIADDFKRLAARAGVTATWSQIRDTTATAIKAIARSQGHPGLESQLLAHGDRGTSRYYAQVEPQDLDVTHLAAALDAYLKRLDLKP